jgi:hypothetical protein
LPPKQQEKDDQKAFLSSDPSEKQLTGTSVDDAPEKKKVSMLGQFNQHLVKE